MLDHGKQHIAHLAFIFRRHQNHVRHASQVGNIQQSMMRRAVTSGNPAAIQAELDVQVLNADIVNQLIERALQKRRVDRADRLQAFNGQSRGKSHAVLFGDTDIERAFGKSFERRANAGAVRHRGCQRHDTLVLLHQFAERLTKNLRIRRRLRR